MLDLAFWKASGPLAWQLILMLPLVSNKLHSVMLIDMFLY